MVHAAKGRDVDDGDNNCANRALFSGLLVGNARTAHYELQYDINR